MIDKGCYQSNPTPPTMVRSHITFLQPRHNFSTPFQLACHASKPRGTVQRTRKNPQPTRKKTQPPVENAPLRLEDWRTARVSPLTSRGFQERPRHEDARSVLAEGFRRLVPSVETPLLSHSRFAPTVRHLGRGTSYDSDGEEYCKRFLSLTHPHRTNLTRVVSSKSRTGSTAVAVLQKAVGGA